MSAKRLTQLMLLVLVLSTLVLSLPMKVKAQDNTLCGYFQDSGYYYYDFHPYGGNQWIGAPFTDDNFQNTFGFDIHSGLVWIELTGPSLNRSGVLTGFDNFRIVDSCEPAIGFTGVYETDAAPLSIPYFRYPVSYEVGEGVDYEVGSDLHLGADEFAIDFVYPTEGMDIYPALAGRIVYADCQPVVYGCVVAIRHWDDNKWDKKYYSIYAHLQTGSITVKVGDIVDGTKPIGSMGMTGIGANNTVHLHFAVRSSDKVYGGLTALYGQVTKDNIITPAFNVRPYLH